MGRCLTFLIAVMATLCMGVGPSPAQEPPDAGLAELAAIRPVIDCAALAAADVSEAVGARVTIAAAKLYEGDKPFCGVRGIIAPHIGFAIKLPTAGWTQRYLQVGCGGLCGTIALRSEHDSGCVPVTNGQIAIASTDMGHAGGMGGDASWGADAGLRADFAFRGVHLTALAAKAIITRYYGAAPKFAYFSGCSDGGREALIEAQRFPADFNGIAAGAPALNFLVQNTFYHAWMAASNIGPDGRYILTAAKLPALHKAALAACDGADGLVDGQITDPRLCKFDPAAATCQPGAAPSDACLTAAEVAVARKFYAGPRDANGTRFTIGGPQVGSELSWAGVFVPRSADDSFVLSPRAALDVIKYLAFPANPPAGTTLADFHFDQATFDRLAAMHPLYDATDVNLAAFAAVGGRLLLYHGWSDPHISPINTIAYYEGVEKALGTERARGFVRLFVFPGLYHCGGGDGPAEFDILTPLMRWTEKGVAPDVIVAGRAAGNEAGPGAMAPPGGKPGGSPPAMMADAEPFAARLDDRPANASDATIDRARPVFAYPRVARYDGKGSIDAAASFVAGDPFYPSDGTYEWAGAAFMAAR